MPLAEPLPEVPIARLGEPVRLALDCLPDPTLILDAHDAVVFANAAFARMTGFDSAEVEGVPLNDLTQVSGSPNDALLPKKGGGLVAAQLTVRPMAGDLGASFRLVRLDEDQTRRSLVEELSAGLEVKGEFLARVSHELRTPLTAMQEGLDIVLDGLTGPLNEQQVEFLELARRNVQRLSRLVKDTLELGSLKRGQPRRPRHSVNLDTLILGCVQRYSGAEYDPVGPVWAVVDEVGVHDSLEKLIDNAIRHSQGGSVRVAMHSEGGEALVSVNDLGPGIPQDKLEEIFGEFEQLTLGAGRTVGGVGLGLTIVRMVVEQHGGRIWAESAPGQGASFFFTLKTCSLPVEKFHDNCDHSQNPAR